MLHRLSVMVHTPAHSGLGHALTYTCAEPLPPGTLVRVPLGQRETLGVVWDDAPADDEGHALKPVASVLELVGALHPTPAVGTATAVCRTYPRPVATGPVSPDVTIVSP